MLETMYERMGRNKEEEASQWMMTVALPIPTITPITMVHSHQLPIYVDVAREVPDCSIGAASVSLHDLTRGWRSDRVETSWCTTPVRTARDSKNIVS